MYEYLNHSKLPSISMLYNEDWLGCTKCIVWNCIKILYFALILVLLVIQISSIWILGGAFEVTYMKLNSNDSNSIRCIKNVK